MGILFGVSRDKCKDNLLHESIESNETRSLDSIDLCREIAVPLPQSPFNIVSLSYLKRTLLGKHSA